MSIKTVTFNESSFIKSVSWDENSETLFVEFNSKTTWVYYNIPQDVYEEMMNSISVGSYFNKNIRDKYPSQRINYKFKNGQKTQEEQ
jgi:hypothetical protein